MNTSSNASAATTLSFSDLRGLGSWDRANRWFPDAVVESYFRSIRTPSRSWPYSYAKAACTSKFLNWLEENRSATYESVVPDSVRSARIAVKVAMERQRLAKASLGGDRGRAQVAEAMGL